MKREEKRRIGKKAKRHKKIIEVYILFLERFVVDRIAGRWKIRENYWKLSGLLGNEKGFVFFREIEGIIGDYCGIFREV